MSNQGAPGPWDLPPSPGSEPVLARTRFRVSAADVAAAWRSHLWWRYTRPSALIVPSLLGLGAAGLDAALNPGSPALLFAVPLLGIPMLIATGRLCRYALIPVLARRTYRQTRSYQEEWTVELTQSGSRARTATTEHFVPWSHYVAWSETDKVILLYHNDTMFQFIPRAGTDTDAMRVFRELAVGLAKR